MGHVLSVQLTVNDIGALRFAFSPLAEVTHSLRQLASGSVDPRYRGWFESVQGRLRGPGTDLLTDVVTRSPRLVALLCAAPSDMGTTMQRQLRVLRDVPHGHLERWGTADEGAAARESLRFLRGGPDALADLLWQYWAVALEPHWAAMRAVLEQDVAFRATEQTRHGTTAMIRGLHPAVGLTEGVLTLPRTGESRHVPAGAGVVLVPCVFADPDLALAGDGDADVPTALLYRARGIDRLWSPDRKVPDGNSLAALLGRRRAAILTCLDLPMSTSELAVRLGQTRPSVSQHLAVLRRSGLVTSWRSGRWVLYRQTRLAEDMVGANDSDAVEQA
jgi:DNA-binding transcriptional ArsR family regulator